MKCIMMYGIINKLIFDNLCSFQNNFLCMSTENVSLTS